MERRLAAIFAADMVGYSRLIEVDEVRTLARLKSHRKELIDLRVEAHVGRIINLTGDAMIGEFTTGLESLQCAVLFRRARVPQEPDLSDERNIFYRAAINLDDVNFQNHDG